MKKLFASFLMGALCLLFINDATAQQAALQVIHNSPDVNADTVDIYVNGNLYKDDFAFRTATAYDSVPAGVALNIGVAPASSNRTGGNGSMDIIETFGPFTLSPLTNYLIIAQGVLDPSQYDPANTNGMIEFDLAVVAPALSAGSDPNLVSVLVSHGSVDAPAVDIFANGGETALLNDVPFPVNTGGYINLPPAEYVLSVAASADSTNPVANFYLNASGLAGGAAVIFASGFLTPADEPMGAKGFGLFAALADGTVLPLTASGTSKIQVIHNAADPAVSSVDVYIDIITDTVKVEDVAFRKATGFVEVPAGYPLKVTFAPDNSTSITEGIATISTPELADMENYHVIANGVTDAMSMDWTANPDGEDIAFQLFYQAGAREAGSMGMVDLSVFHGSTDAPTVDVLVNAGTPPFVDGAPYGAFAPYQSVAPGNYDLNITLDNDNANLLYTFGADVSGLADRAGIVLASGFLTNVTDPSANRMGDAFGLLVILDDGTDVLLPLKPNNTNINGDLTFAGTLEGLAPNPATTQVTVDFSVKNSVAMSYRIVDARGRTVQSERLGMFAPGAYSRTIMVDNLRSGSYALVLSGRGFRAVRKLVIVD
jgi:hypothetical protein